LTNATFLDNEVTNINTLNNNDITPTLTLPP
jgi:hypothetical protein